MVGSLDVRSWSLARPRSPITTRSYRSSRPGRNVAVSETPRPPGPATINRFAGFTSRWTMPASCSVPRPCESARMTASRPSASTPGPSGSRSLNEPPRGELHDQVGATVVELTDVVHRDHERAVDAAEELGLPHEAGPRVRVHRVAGIEDLDGGVTVERVVVGLDDRREPALAQHRPDVVATDPLGHPSEQRSGAAQSRSATSKQLVISESMTLWSCPRPSRRVASSRRGSPPTWLPR